MEITKSADRRLQSNNSSIKNDQDKNVEGNERQSDERGSAELAVVVTDWEEHRTLRLRRVHRIGDTRNQLAGAPRIRSPVNPVDDSGTRLSRPTSRSYAKGSGKMIARHS